MKLDLSKQPTYWDHRKFNNPSTTCMPAIMIGALVLGFLIALMV